ncbi:Cytochrome c oxidase polypeptide I [Planctomycetales bacterium 10988]|nr:Cytochrome c oxidase polypeptide I [Planctomycetales bacterium 10988]
MAVEVQPTPGASPAPDSPLFQSPENYLTHPSTSIGSWLFTLDHKRIGIMYLVSILLSFLIGGLLALAVRLELMWPGQTIMSAETYNHVFTLHGAIMTFLFIIPSVPASIGNFVLPIMLGAKDLAFPRMNLGSYYLWVLGAVFFVGSMLMNGLDTGWTFYTPYSTTTSSSVISALLGVFVLGFSSIFTGLNFIVTIHTMRPAGMTWFRMPLLLWALYATAIIQILATPVIGITGLLLIAERLLQIGIFDPALGGDPVMFQHFFWFYSHPAVYIMILPAMGIISELVSIHSHKPIFGYRFIAFSSVALALLGFLVWGHHMFTSGQSPVSAIVFSALTFSVSIPSAIKVFNWLATLWRGSISFTTPMCYALSFIFLFTVGGLTGLFLGTLATDVHLHDTYFVVAHFHYVMMGGTAVAFVGGIFHWWPKMTGRMYNEWLGRLSALIVLIGFNLTFFPQFLLGTHGMPRRYFDYEPEYAFLHFLSSVGAFTLGFGLLLAAIALILSLFNGKRAPANPWGAVSLEWQCASPPPYYNFKRAPVASFPYDFTRVEYDPPSQSYIVRAEEKGAATADH